MAWRETPRAKAAKVRREWYCDECQATWVTVQSADEAGEVECPECARLPEQVRRPVGIATNASRALAVAEQIMREDYGETNMHDHLRKGETGAMAPPPIQTAEAETITRELVGMGAPVEMAPHLQEQAKTFWGATGKPTPQANPFGVPTTIEQARVMAAPAAAETRAAGHDPIGMLHQAGKKGLDPVGRQNLKVYSK